MDVVERASPPGFIVDACRCIELCLTGGNLSETTRVDPELLRKLRSGRGTMSEIETVLGMVLCLTGPKVIDAITNTDLLNPTVLFTILCDSISKQSAWNCLLVSSLNRLRNSSMHCSSLALLPESRIYGHDINLSGEPEVITMKYRSVIQLLHKYHDLDRARVLNFKEIHSILVDMQRSTVEGLVTAGATDVGSVASVDLPAGDTAFKLSVPALKRLLDNLWSSGALVDPINRSNVNVFAASASSKTPPTSGKMGSKQQQTAHSTASSGIETLRSEYDAGRQLLSEAQQYNASECAFLKWASSVACPVMIDSDSITNEQLSSREPSKDETLNDTLQQKATRQRTADTTNAPAAARLDKVVSDASPMLGELERLMLELVDCGELCFDEISTLSERIDENNASLGLSVEEIDAYFTVVANNSSTMREGVIEGGEAGSPGEEEVNLYEYLDSECAGRCMLDNIATENNLKEKEKKSLHSLRRHIQVQLDMPVYSAATELFRLRDLHQHTLLRTAKACDKFSPFEIVWKQMK